MFPGGAAGSPEACPVSTGIRVLGQLALQAIHGTIRGIFGTAGVQLSLEAHSAPYNTAGMYSFANKLRLCLSIRVVT
ncbi:hypothetical protein NDU88_006391 [Pleurodeles waltl]|uniref:Uncharacterized protein n=1 Tax=Pleurodeles waltl TaxID=8319 RepID=A0AAV7MDA8_PLEWA|nr:hypothetical protein NDU88_006391 [Pleurodeles waltl]